MQPIDTYNFRVIRGDTFALDVGLTASFSEVLDDPEAYVGKLVLRDDQDDTLTPLLTLTATPEPEDVLPGHSPPEPCAYLSFTASASQTQGLPEWDLVGYVELRTVLADTLVQRLFNSRVAVSD